jgi:hypothetical protein
MRDTHVFSAGLARSPGTAVQRQGGLYASGPWSPRSVGQMVCCRSTAATAENGWAIDRHPCSCFASSVASRLLPTRRRPLITTKLAARSGVSSRSRQGSHVPSKKGVMFRIARET